MIESTIDEQEVSKFAKLSNYWWDKEGPLHTLHAINPARISFIEQYTSLNNQRVLDVGCGGGILCEAMVTAGAQVTGIDAEPHAIAAAKAHAESQALTINYQCMPVEEYTDTGFDVITCMELLEHVQNPGLLLAHCKRLLKPQGLLLLSTLSRTVKAYATAIVAAEYLLGLLPRQTHNYRQFIKPSELRAMAVALDFDWLGMSGMYYNPFTKQASLCSDVQVNYLMAFVAQD